MRIFMTETVQRLKSELGSLSQPERAELAEFLLTSLESEPEADASVAWQLEVKRRMTEIRTGQATGVPAESLLAELRQRYP
jgi:putative addiction module component (TIGR02574 family)